MITILYDTDDERQNLEDFFLRGIIGCCDFSDVVYDCSNRSCDICRQHLIDNCIQDRAEYQKVNPFLKNKPESCRTCANLPICWTASTAAAHAPCRHYIKEG